MQQILREDNKVRPEDRAVHEWYRFVLSFPPHLVRDYIQKFQLGSDSVILDPFCGTGTTLVESKKLGLESIGVESNPMASFASQVKIDWSTDSVGLQEHANLIEKEATESIDWQTFNEPSNLRKLSTEAESLILTNSISPVPLSKVLFLLESIERHHNDSFSPYEKLALAKALVSGVSNLRFGPEVGLGTIKEDAPVVSIWSERIKSVVEDLNVVKSKSSVPSKVLQGDSRLISRLLGPESVDAVITSPPYPNEKDYTRTTRLESVILGLVRSKSDIQQIKRSMIRSNTRGVYKEDVDDRAVATHEEIQNLAKQIENRRLELGKTSGFERLYGRVTRLYFGGMYRHLSDLRSVLKPGSQLAYVVGDQASYFRIMIRTGRLLGDIARSLGYELIKIETFRNRMATATGEQLNEEVVVLRWDGSA